MVHLWVTLREKHSREEFIKEQSLDFIEIRSFMRILLFVIIYIMCIYA